MTPGWERGAGVGAWHRGYGWGFCSIRSLASACRRRVAPLLVQFPHLAAPSTLGELDRAPLMVQFPPFDGGFAALDASCRRVAPLLVQFPPFAGGEDAVRGSVAPKVQTTSATNANNGVSRVRWSAMWAQRRLASRGARTRTAEYAR